MRKRTTGALIGLLGSTALLAGCGQASAIDAAAPAAQAHTAQRDISGSNCTAQDFRVDLNVQPGHPDQFLLAMTNTSGKPCEIGGWVNLKPQNMAGETIEQIPARTVEVPGPPEHSTLQPGRTAFAGVHLELGAKNDPGTYVTSGFPTVPIYFTFLNPCVCHTTNRNSVKMTFLFPIFSFLNDQFMTTKIYRLSENILFKFGYNWISNDCVKIFFTCFFWI